MKRQNGRRTASRTRAAEKDSMLEQLTVLILGAIALLGFLLV